MAATQTVEVPTAPGGVDGDDPPAGRAVSIRGRRYPVLLPRLGDPRLHVAATIVTVQVLGQVVLGFDVSIAQILIAIGTAAVLELAIVARTARVIAWPASALLTGNGVALILRVPGTEHGDWWSTRGWPIFVAASGISVLSKYAIRVGGRHLFNPSNFGLVVVFLTFGAAHADPQDLWWGPWRPGLVATIVVIAVGGLSLSWRLRLFPVALTFWGTFAVGIGILAAGGHAITARWHVGPLVGWDYWLVYVTSPEIVIFVFFMITDPKTAPLGRAPRAVYAFAVAVLASFLAGLQTTEYATKVSLLAALTVVCAFRPLLERWFRAERMTSPAADRWLRRTGPAATPGRVRPTLLGVAALVVVALGSSVLVAAAGRSTSGAVVDQLPDVRLADAGERPAVDLPPGAVPTFTVDDDLAAVEGATQPGDEQAIARDLVEDLAIEADAVRLGDPELAATASFGARLDETLGRIAAQADGAVSATTVALDEGRVVLLRDPVSPQARPQLGVAASGTVTEVSMDASGRVTDQRSGPFEGVFLLTKVGDHHLLGAVLPADTPMLVGGWEG